MGGMSVVGFMELVSRILSHWAFTRPLLLLREGEEIERGGCDCKIVRHGVSRGLAR